MKLLRRVIFATFFLLSFTPVLVSADDDDPPGRVARLQYMAGSVSIQPRGTDDWVAGSLNRPLTTADNIWTEKDSRAELNLGTAVLRMNGETSLTLTNISDNAVQVDLHQGTLNLQVRRLYRGEIFEIDTPNIAFTVQKKGEYRFDVGPSGDATLVTVRKGEGDATGNGPAVRVRAHQRARFTGGTSLAHEIYEAPSRDGFDDWCRVRDRREAGAVSARYVSPGVIGYEDLDDYGYWRVTPAYGPVWVPVAVVPGWAPYRYGHWVWVSPWGWTWIDDAPWGFAPFHYGRWVYYGGYWGWAPGPVYVRPVYAPALVAWFGGSHFGIGLSFGGGYGWCPLGYGEPFVPWYRGSPRYFRSVNITNTRITNITNITNNYYYGNGPRRSFPLANLKAPGAVTAAPERTIVHSLPVAKSMIPVSREQARALGRVPLGEKVSLTPTRESMLGANAGRPVAIPPERTFNRPVVSKLARPAAPARIDKIDKNEIAELDKPARPLPAIAAKPAVAAPPPGRFVPRPPQRGEGPSASPAVTAHAVPRPPMARAPAAREDRPGAMRPVPRPPDTNRAPDARPTPSTRRDAPESGERIPTYHTLPAVRAVPRPPTQDSVSRPPDVERHTSPRQPDLAVHERTSHPDVPRPTGPVAPPSSNSGSEDRGPRFAPPSAPADRSPNGASPRSYGESPRSYAEPPRSYRESPRSYGESPRTYESPRSSAPPPSRSTPHDSPAPSNRGSSSASQAPAPPKGR
jgi:hypothetical protein